MASRISMFEDDGIIPPVWLDTNSTITSFEVVSGWWLQEVMSVNAMAAAKIIPELNRSLVFIGISFDKG